jgi:hypothetical protein
MTDEELYAYYQAKYDIEGLAAYYDDPELDTTLDCE